MKVDFEGFSCNNILPDFKFLRSVVWIAMDVWWNDRRKENVYKKKDSSEYIFSFHLLDHQEISDCQIFQ